MIPKVQGPIFLEKTALDSLEKDHLKRSFEIYAWKGLLGINNLKKYLIKVSQIPVNQTAFCDLGFDPSFSVDGNYFYQEQAGFLLRLLTQMVNTIKHYTSFFQTPEKRAFQELIQIEKHWQKAAQAKGMLYAVDNNDLNKAFWQLKAPYICRLKEHRFLKYLSEIANLSGPAEHVYTGELLRPLHALNRPQKPSMQSKEHVEKGAENDDLGRLSTQGFVLLDNHHTKKYKNFYINHSDFLQAIHATGDELKHSMRELRIAIRKEDYHAFKEKLSIFNDCWDKYIKSHKLLEDLSFVYSQKNPFEAKYQDLENLYREMQNPDIYRKENFLIDLNARFTDVFDYEEGSEQLYDVFLSKLPDSLTAKKKTLEKQAS